MDRVASSRWWALRGRAVGLALAVAMGTGLAHASGTPHLPQNFTLLGRQVSREDLRSGKELFAGTALVGDLFYARLVHVRNSAPSWSLGLSVTFRRLGI